MFGFRDDLRKKLKFVPPYCSILPKIPLNADGLAIIAKPARASVSISMDTPMNAEAYKLGFAPKGP